MRTNNLSTFPLSTIAAPSTKLLDPSPYTYSVVTSTSPTMFMFSLFLAIAITLIPTAVTQTPQGFDPSVSSNLGVAFAHNTQIVTPGIALLAAGILPLCLVSRSHFTTTAALSQKPQEKKQNSKEGNKPSLTVDLPKPRSLHPPAPFRQYIPHFSQQHLPGPHD